MTVTCVHVRVIPEGLKKFIEATVANHKASVNEPGNLRFDLLQEENDVCSFMIYEAYESQEAADQHKLTPHYLAWREEVKDLMAEPRKGVKYKIVEPSDRGRW